MPMTNTIGPQGTNFVHDEDPDMMDAAYSVRMITTSEPQKMNMPEDMGEAWWVDIPFADLRHFILKYLQNKTLKNITQMGDDELESWLTASD